MNRANLRLSKPMGPVGLIAGSGVFPIILAEEMRRLGYSVAAVAFIEETLSDLSDRVDKIYWLNVGQLNQLISFFKEQRINHVVMVGGFKKDRYFSNFQPDFRSLALIMRFKEKKDDLLQRALAEELKGEGITIDSPTTYFPALLAPAGNFSRREPTPQEWEDLKFALDVGTLLGRADIGHCVAVKKGVVLAVEAIEGTNETIRRAGRFASGAVIVKISKPQQDLRFDLPTVGSETVRAMVEAGASCLGVEAGKTIILDRSEMETEADAAGVGLVGIHIR